MMLLAATAFLAATAAPAGQGSRAVVQASATVRILSGARIDWDKDSNNKDIPQVRDSVVRTGTGAQPARLIEFE